jgi:hypothetical protein
MSVTYRASINNLPDKSRSSAGRTVHEGHGNRNGTDEVIRTDNGSSQSHLLCPVLLLLFITEIILLLTLLYSSLLYSTGFHWLFPLYWWAFQRFVQPSLDTLVFVSVSLVFSPKYKNNFHVNDGVSLIFLFYNSCNHKVGYFCSFS